MLYTSGHGGRVVDAGKGDGDLRLMGVLPREAAQDGPPGFAFLFPDAPESNSVPNAVREFSRLATKMMEPGVLGASAVSTIAPIFTYFGQFIVHDVSAADDVMVNGQSIIAENPLRILSRHDVTARLINARTVPLALDAVYGAEQPATDVATRLQAALRDGARMRLGAVRRTDRTRPAFPTDDAADLPRVGALIDQGTISVDDLPDAVRPESGEAGTSPRRRLAHIADDRNDENLILAQLHVAFLRLHNALVAVERTALGRGADEEAVFRAARRDAERMFQWLVVNEYLPAVCGQEVVDAVVAEEAPLYGRFLARLGGPGESGKMPLPMEFTFAGCRFGHSMIRTTYDFNAAHGVPKPGGNSVPATLKDMFRFTGRRGLDDNEALPSDWIIDWPRFLPGPMQRPEHMAGPIDTNLARSLINLEEPAPAQMSHLARRNLHRGYVYNLPSGQALHAQFVSAGVSLGPPLSAAELTAGPAGGVLRDIGLVDQTPLWFYLLKEAETRSGGDRLGPLGARLVAETLVGLIVHNPRSYWQETGSAPNGRWCPLDACLPGDAPVCSLEGVLRAAGVLGP